MKQFSEETKRKMSEAAKRRSQSEQFLKRVKGYWKPFCTEEELRKDYEVSVMSQNEIAAKYSVTLKRVQTSMRRYEITSRPAIKRNQIGCNNSSWKGDSACYAAFHYRLSSLYGKPQKCEICGTSDPKRTYDWANLTGRYDDPSDYKRMCRSCHWKYDDKAANFKGAVGGRSSTGVNKI